MRTPTQYGEDAERTNREIETRERQKWWYSLSTLEREAEYNKRKPCQHKYEFQPIKDYENMDDEGHLRECRSYDPYFYTKHTPEHSVEKFFKGECDCNTCVGKFGMERNDGKNKFKLAVVVQLVFVFLAGRP